MGSPPPAWRGAGTTLIRVSDGSERDLRARRDRLDPRARLRRAAHCRGGGDLVHVGVDVVEHEADVGDGVPVDAKDIGCLATAEDAAGHHRRHAGRAVVVEVQIAVARGEFPGAPAARAHGAVRPNAAIGAGRRDVLSRLAGHDVARLGVAAVEGELGSRCGRRQARLVDDIAIIFALGEEAAEPGGELGPVDNGMLGRDSARVDEGSRIDPELRPVAEADSLGDRAGPASIVSRLEDVLAVETEMKRVAVALKYLVGGARRAAHLLLVRSGMSGARSRPCDISAGPGAIRVPAHAEGRAGVGRGEPSGDYVGRGPLDEHDVVRARRLVEREGNVEVAEVDRKRAEAVVADEGVLDVGAARAGDGVDIAVRGAAEVEDEGIVPIAHELAEHAEARAPRIDAAGQAVLAGRCLRVDAQIVRDVEMQAAGEFDRVLPVGARDARPVGRRHRDPGPARGRRSGGWGGRRWRAPCLLVHLVLQLLQLPLELLYLLLELVGGLCRGGMDGEEHRAPQCPAQEMLYPLFHVLPLPSGVRGRRGPDRRPLAARNLSSHSYTPATLLLPFEDCRKEIGAMQSPETLKTAFSNRR